MRRTKPTFCDRFGAFEAEFISFSEFQSSIQTDVRWLSYVKKRRTSYEEKCKRMYKVLKITKDHIMKKSYLIKKNVKGQNYQKSVWFEA